MSKNRNGKNNDKVRFWFKGVPFLIGRQAAVRNDCHVKVKTLVKGKLKFVALRLEKNGDSIYSAFRVELPPSKMRRLSKAESMNTIAYQSLEKRPS